MTVEDLITTREAAEKLGVSMRRVTALIKEGRLPSMQIGREHLIKQSDLELVRERRPGRPTKAKAEKDDTSGEKEYYSKTALKRTGWTDAKIKDLLGEPDLHHPQECGRMLPRYYYLDSRVDAIEKTKEFKEWKPNKTGRSKPSAGGQTAESSE
ncbi:MAG: helix-turn-helix domain-containing protein [Acidobacteriota bacterium]|nr:helix-turn-helix domain-containing protein [Acidobacteriota bacterium]